MSNHFLFSLVKRLLLACACWVIAGSSFAQETPTSSVALQAWKQYVDSTLRRIKRYRLNGVVKNSNPANDDISDTSGTWEVIVDQDKFKWNFSVPKDAPKILSFDGKRWWLYGKSDPIPNSSTEAAQNGKILINPKKVLLMDPRQPYLDGLVQVYPIDLSHLLRNPTHSASNLSIPDEYLARSGKVSIRNSVFDGKNAFRLTIEKDNLASKLAIPEITYLRIIDSQFVPVGFEHRTASGLVIRMHLQDYSAPSTVAYPTHLITEVLSQDNTSANKLLVSSSADLKVTDVGKPFSEPEFQINFPAGTVVWNEETKDAYKVGGKLSKDYSVKPANTKATLPTYVGIALLGLSIIVISFSIKKTMNSKK